MNHFEESKRFFTLENRIIQFAEEAGELSQALSKIYREGASDELLVNLYTEIADVEILLEQFKARFDCPVSYALLYSNQLAKLKKAINKASRCEKT